jgi:hypothetical protein
MASVGGFSIVGKMFALDAHNVAFTFQGDRLMADEVSCVDGVASSVWVDVTDWSRAELFAWLGY